MNIQKAIEILQDILGFVAPGDPPEEHEAIALGIEALKWRLHCEKVNAPAKYPPLPGETIPNRYRIMNRITREWWEGKANSAHEACQLTGWLIGDCWVRQYSPKGSGGWKKPDSTPEPGIRHKHG